MNCNEAKLPLGVLTKVSRFQDYISKRYHSDSTDWPLAKNRIQEVADSVVSTLKLESPPINLDPVTTLFDVRVSRRRNLLDNISGQLVPRKDGFEIIVAEGTATHLSTRWRFSIAHELGHTLFFSHGPRGPERIFPKQIRPLSPLFKKEEALCDSFAAALLVPKIVLACFHSRSPTLAQVIHASLRFEVMPDVMFRRLLSDFGFLQERVIYAIRSTPEIRVNVFRGDSRKNTTGLPTPNSVKLLLASTDRRDYISTLKQLAMFSNSQFCMYGDRTLYFMF